MIRFSNSAVDPFDDWKGAKIDEIAIFCAQALKLIASGENVSSSNFQKYAPASVSEESITAFCDISTEEVASRLANFTKNIGVIITAREYAKGRGYSSIAEMIINAKTVKITFATGPDSAIIKRFIGFSKKECGSASI